MGFKMGRIDWGAIVVPGHQQRRSLHRGSIVRADGMYARQEGQSRRQGGERQPSWIRTTIIDERVKQKIEKRRV